jgi:hypothetical protein
MSVHGENWPKIHITTLWGPYSVSIRRFGVVHKFLGVLKKYRFLAQTPKGLAIGFYQKMSAYDENWAEIHISSLWGPYSCSVRYYGVVHILFWGFEKYRVLAQNPKMLAFGFTEISLSFYWKCLFMVKAGWKSVSHPREAHILSRLDILVLYINFLGAPKNIKFQLKT